VIMPDAFMPGAEQTELMNPITELVLRHALEQVARWHAEGVEISVAVNASARNLRDTRFPGLVRSILRDTGVSGSLLEIEITENTVMTDPTRTAAVLAQLRTLGVGLSIDDFGTGYSSLAHLRSLPIDCVKIDRTFITNMTSRTEDITIVRSIIDLARNLGLGTIGEGIETDDALNLLRTMGCDSAQGYHIARPGPAESVVALHRARSVPMLVAERSDR